MGGGPCAAGGPHLGGWRRHGLPLAPLRLLAICAVACLAALGAAVALRVLGESQTAQLALSVACACFAAWLVVALAGPAPFCGGGGAASSPPPKARVKATCATVKGEGSAVELAADVASTTLPSTRRVRDFLAELNVDRRL